MKIPVNEAPAGPEMDAAVAEALGWLPYESDGVWYWKDMSDDDFPYWNHHANGYGYVEDLKPWSPSTDIAAAWELDNDNWRWRFDETPHTLAVVLYTSVEMQRKATWISPRTPKGTIVVQNYWEDDKASTYAVGRCRAFLKANGVKHIEVPE